MTVRPETMLADADVLDRIRQALTAPGAPSSDFDLNNDQHLLAGRKTRPAGVLCGLEEVDGKLQVILTVRSSALKHHPGQIAFPGGKQEESDADVTAAALREAQEEIGLPPENVEVLGYLPPHETVSVFAVTPVVARIRAPFIVRPEPGEVAQVFRVPLDHVLNIDNYSVQSRRWRGQMRHYFTVPYGPYYIWGATARMLRVLAERMQDT